MIKLNRVTQLPANFVWGAAMAAYQVEGATQEDGKGQNMWDVYLKKQGRFSPDPASDFYHLYPIDLKLAHDFGLNAIRLSISWSRIFPDIDGKPNTKGVNHYHRVFTECLKNHLVPYVALHHFDSPEQMLEEGDWLNRKNIRRFVKYAEFCFKEFPEVKNWFTINEMISLASGQYLGGQFPPNHHFNVSEAIQAEHNMLLAHAQAVIKYHELGMKGRIGCIQAIKPGFPNTNKSEDIQAAARYDAYNNRFLLDGALLGIYQPETMKLLNQVLEANNGKLIIEPGDMEILKKAAPLNGMFGFNYYRSEFVENYNGENEERVNTTGDKSSSSFKFKGVGKFVKRPEIPRTDWDWTIYPAGLYKMLLRLKHDYPNMPTIYITENGLGLKEELPADKLINNDDKRIDFIDQHVAALLKARKAGVNVNGYFIWSLQDQFSWVNGYNKRYGLFYVDYQTQKRYPKRSAYWFKELSKTMNDEEGES